MPDVNGLGDKIVSSVRGFVARSLEALEARIDALEARPAPVDGKDGRDGTSVQVEDVQPMVRDFLDGLETRTSDWVNTRVAEFLNTLQPPKDGAQGTPGIDGKPGLDGAPGRDGLNGKDGAPGADGRSVSLAEIDKLLEARFANYVIEHERRLPDLLQRMIDQIEKPRDGRDGKDGEDGFDLRHFDVVQTDERSFTLRFKDLNREKTGTVTLPVPIVREIWKPDVTYRQGDIVTWGGSAFVKTTDEPGGKPEEGPQWRLFIKRGRDGKDGAKGDRGEQGKAGRNGRDLTQMGSDGSKWS